MMNEEDAVLQGGDPFPEEAIPLVIFNEEKKRKLNPLIILLFIFLVFELNEEGRQYLS